MAAFTAKRAKPLPFELLVIPAYVQVPVSLVHIVLQGPEHENKVITSDTVSV